MTDGTVLFKLQASGLGESWEMEESTNGDGSWFGKYDLFAFCEIV